jgi:phosphoribosyl-AMP cyclohydrolase
MDRHQLEEGDELRIDFGKIAAMAAKDAQVIPVAVQNAETGEVILLAYTNETALRKAVATRSLILWSTSRNALWEKGATSGETFDLTDVFVNCEQNSLLYKVRPRRNGICHTRNAKGAPRNCFYRQLDFDSGVLKNVDP